MFHKNFNSKIASAGCGNSQDRHCAPLGTNSPISMATPCARQETHTAPVWRSILTRSHKGWGWSSSRGKGSTEVPLGSRKVVDMHTRDSTTKTGCNDSKFWVSLKPRMSLHPTNTSVKCFEQQCPHILVHLVLGKALWRLRLPAPKSEPGAPPPTLVLFTCLTVTGFLAREQPDSTTDRLFRVWGFCALPHRVSLGPLDE